MRKAQDELAHLNRVAAMSELAGSIAHELNQPLAAILSNAQAAERLLAQTPDLPRVGGDGVQLQQVLLNLLVNALDAVSRRPPDARLVVMRTWAGGTGRVELSVADSGEGIGPGDLERIFEPFFTTKAQGLGVGLAISRSIVEAHGGRLWAESHPGVGATLRCALPVWDEARPTRAGLLA